MTIRVPTSDELAMFLLLDEQRYLADQRRKAFEEDSKLLKGLLKSYCEAEGGKARLHGYDLVLQDGGKSVPWQELFAARLGYQAVLEAQLATPQNKRLVIRPAR